VPLEIPDFELLGVLSQKFLMQEGISGVSVVRGSGRRVRVYVESEEYVPFIPNELADSPVEVVVAGRFRILGSAAVENRFRFRPVPGGCSIGTLEGGTGTLACWVYDAGNGRRLMLSNRHVFDGPQGTPVIQPGVHDGGSYPDDVVGYVLRYSQIGQPPMHNSVDAAVAVPADPGLVSDEVIGLDVVYELAEPYEGMVVAKSGRTTGVTAGTIIDTNVSIKVYGYPFGYAIFTNQILVMPAMGQPGDSGSLTVDRDTGKVVGLLFSGSDRATAINRMDLVLQVLGVSLKPGSVLSVPRAVDWRPILAGLAPVVAVGSVISVNELADLLPALKGEAFSWAQHRARPPRPRPCRPP